MVVTQHMCHRCGAIFKRKLFLERHLNKKKRCEYITLEEDENGDTQAIKVSTDDIILNKQIDFSELPKFDFKKQLEAGNNYSILISAIRRSGKTTMMRYIYPLLKSLYDIVIFISNSIDNPIYNFVTGPRFPSHSREMLKDIFKFQTITQLKFNICVLFDDCISANNKNDDSLLQFFLRGRNKNCTIIMCTQSTKLINKNNRGNSDFVIIGNNPSAEFREDVLKAFLLGAVPLPNYIKTKSQKIDYLNKFLLHYTKNFGFLVMNNINRELYEFKTPI